jgi:ribosomal protein S6--L-glutamate ligase
MVSVSEIQSNRGAATFNRRVIALEGRLRSCRNVLTLGVRTNFSDYTREEIAAIRAAATIYYPSTFYADLFDAAGKKTFPSYHTYKCVQDKIKQTALFELREIPHPRTRVFYGPERRRRILEQFRFPFVAKVPRGSALGRGVFLVRNPGELDAYCGRTTVAYIQEYLPADRDMRIIVIGNRVVHAYWRIAPEDGFLTNLAAGGRVSLDPLPPAALDLARHTAAACGWNDVGLDICMSAGRLWVIEGNMKYGRQGFRQAGIDYVHLMETMIENEEI